MPRGDKAKYTDKQVRKGGAAVAARPVRSRCSLAEYYSF